MTKDVQFCPCGRALDKEINKRYDATTPGFCNKECKDAEERKQKRGPKQRKKYGVAGYIYG